MTVMWQVHISASTCVPCAVSAVKCLCDEFCPQSEALKTYSTPSPVHLQLALARWFYSVHYNFTFSLFAQFWHTSKTVKARSGVHSPLSICLCLCIWPTLCLLPCPPYYYDRPSVCFLVPRTIMTDPLFASLSPVLLWQTLCLLLCPPYYYVASPWPHLCFTFVLNADRHLTQKGWKSSTGEHARYVHMNWVTTSHTLLYLHHHYSSTPTYNDIVH